MYLVYWLNTHVQRTNFGEKNDAFSLYNHLRRNPRPTCHESYTFGRILSAYYNRASSLTD